MPYQPPAHRNPTPRTVKRHTASQVPSHEARRGSAQERGYNWTWQKVRADYLRNNPLCVYCEREGRYRSAQVVDHIEPHRGNQELFWNPDNWQSLCLRHHNSAKKREENRAARRADELEAWLKANS
jgi:5-methylcytosine-specific restriction endonuclease McrA